MGKDGPTILYDSNFVLSHEELREFVEFCRKWVVELYDVDKRISLKFIMWKYKDYARVEQRAEFMWQNISFIHLRPSTLELDGGMRCTQDLIGEKFDSNCCNWVKNDRMLEDAFLPNLKFAINMEIEKLQQKLKFLDVLGPENP